MYRFIIPFLLVTACAEHSAPTGGTTAPNMAPLAPAEADPPSEAATEAEAVSSAVALAAEHTEAGIVTVHVPGCLDCGFFFSADESTATLD